MPLAHLIKYGFLSLLAVIATQIFKILNEYERGVVFTFGRFTGVKGPGLIILIPLVQRMVKVDGAFIRRMSSSARKVLQARSSALKPSRIPGNSRRAASVSCRLRPLRWNSRQAK